MTSLAPAAPFTAPAWLRREAEARGEPGPRPPLMGGAAHAPGRPTNAASALGAIRSCCPVLVAPNVAGRGRGPPASADCRGGGAIRSLGAPGGGGGTAGSVPPPASVQDRREAPGAKGLPQGHREVAASPISSSQNGDGKKMWAGRGRPREKWGKTAAGGLEEKPEGGRGGRSRVPDGVCGLRATLCAPAASPRDAGPSPPRAVPGPQRSKDPGPWPCRTETPGDPGAGRLPAPGTRHQAHRASLDPVDAHLRSE